MSKNYTYSINVQMTLGWYLKCHPEIKKAVVIKGADDGRIYINDINDPNAKELESKLIKTVIWNGNTRVTINLMDTDGFCPVEADQISLFADD